MFNNKPIENFQKKNNNHFDKSKFKWLPLEEWKKKNNINTTTPQKVNTFSTASYSKWFDEKNKITMEEWINGLFTWNPITKKTIWYSRKDSKKKMILN